MQFPADIIAGDLPHPWLDLTHTAMDNVVCNWWGKKARSRSAIDERHCYHLSNMSVRTLLQLHYIWSRDSAVLCPTEQSFVCRNWSHKKVQKLPQRPPLVNSWLSYEWDSDVFPEIHSTSETIHCVLPYMPAADNNLLILWCVNRKCFGFLTLEPGAQWNVITAYKRYNDI